jgi:hypothetical protein
MPLLIPAAPESLILLASSRTGGASQAAFSAFSLSKARSDVRQSFDCFHFVPEFFYFEPNLYCTHFLALFECLLLFHITFNQQILDIW